MAEGTLAIVVPAFKSEFFATTLESLACQSDKRFRVYVGDDASPEGLKGICDRFSSSLDLHYTRFPENLGRRSLAAQWSRCVRLSREPWVWLFSDDDLAHPDCVASFLDSLSASRPTFDLYRFPLGVIDQEGRILCDVRSFGETQSAGAFVLAKLREEIKSFAVEYVFSRSAFEREGGFIDFPAGWCADDASWCAIAGQRGIRSIESGGVFWRKSAVNISAPHSPFRRAKTLASIGYLEWLDARLNHHRDLLSEISEREIRGEFRHWFYGQLYSANPFLGPLTAIRVARRLASLTGEGLSSELYGVFRNEARALVRRTRKTVQPDDRTQ